MPEQAKNGDTVRVHYTGRLEDGQVFDTSTEGDPLEFQLGAGEVIPGFDQGVQGMEIGEKKTIEIPVDEGYGPRVDQLVQAVPRQGMNLDAEPQAGMSLIMQLPDGNQIPVTITEVTEEFITLDANHPLAGQKLFFDIELVELRQAA